MIKCFFVDVKSIKSDFPKSNLIADEIEQLADLILESDGLLRPLILQESGAGKYKIIEGHREYYAAVRAKEKNIAKAEMVNAFVLDNSIKKSALAQLNLLSGLPVDRANSSGEESLSLEQLLPAIESTISHQLQPILEQLTKHTKILALLESERQVKIADRTALEKIEPPIVVDRTEDDKKSQSIEIVSPAIVDAEDLPTVIQPDRVVPREAIKSIAKTKKIVEEIDIPAVPISSSNDLPKPPASLEITPKKTTKSRTTSKKTVKEVDPHPLPIVSEGKPSSPPAPKAVAVAKTTKATTKSKPVSNFLASIDPTKATATLDLINTLDRTELTLRMERSGLTTIVKLVASMIEYRNAQANQLIDRWETLLSAKISGLTESVIKKIIDKLK
jgi:ParB-like nuclease domain